jgi:hypothetical protein
MLTASEARIKALQDIFVLREIRDLEEEVLLAAADGAVEVIVSTTSTMAKNPTDTGYSLATEYYNTWTGVNDDRQKRLQMEKVIRYFSDLGYTIERQVNGTSQTTFQWVIAW